jgi:hypothetical protein
VKTKKFDWGAWQENRLKEGRVPTEEEANIIIKMFQECPWCLIRDILIDSGLTDERFPQFYYDVRTSNMQAFKSKN